MERTHFGYRLNDEDFLSIDWEFVFPNSGYAGKIIRGGSVMLKTGVYPTWAECIDEVSRRLRKKIDDAKKEIGRMDDALIKLSEIKERGNEQV